MYAASTLSAIKDKFPDMRSKLERMESRAFSEFNFIGAFIDRYEKEKYSILDVREETIPTCAKQFWSWGGITPEVKAEIEQMLNGTWPY